MPLENVNFYSLPDVYILADQLARDGKQTHLLTRYQSTLGCHPISDNVRDSEKSFAKVAYDLLGIQKERFTVCQFVKACEASGKLEFDSVFDSWVALAPNPLQKIIRPEVQSDLSPLYHFNVAVLNHFKQALFDASKTNPITDIETFSNAPDGHSLDSGALKHARLKGYPIKFEFPRFITECLFDGRVIS